MTTVRSSLNLLLAGTLLVVGCATATPGPASPAAPVSASDAAASAPAAPASSRDAGSSSGAASSSAASSSSAAAPAQPGSTPRDGQHDFDFEIGTWKTRVSVLRKPLTGSTTWVAYEGTSVVSKVWDGRANLVELVADGPAGHFEGLNLRLYNPQSRQWSLNFSNSRGGTLSPPTIGEFRNGRGEFFGQEDLDGRAIFVRFIISDITPNSCRFEQAFSADGGQTWEVNWIATDTRVKNDAERGAVSSWGE